MIDRHNRHRQDTLGVETKLVTQNWATRVNLTIFSMIVVDTWLAYSQCRCDEIERQKAFYTFLAEELIDNKFDTSIHIWLWQQQQNRAQLAAQLFDPVGDPRAGISAHLTPTKKRKRSIHGEILPYCLQG